MYFSVLEWYWPLYINLLISFQKYTYSCYYLKGRSIFTHLQPTNLTLYMYQVIVMTSLHFFVWISVFVRIIHAGFCLNFDLISNLHKLFRNTRNSHSPFYQGSSFYNYFTLVKFISILPVSILLHEQFGNCKHYVSSH